MPIFGQKNVRYTCQVMLLDNTVLKFEVNNKTFGDELIVKVLISLDIYEKEYFGLRYKGRNGNSFWLDPHKLVKRQVHNGQDTIFQFYFGIKYYIADPTRLREEITRYQFFLQVKQDLLLGRITCDMPTAAEICAYAVQSELGDYDSAIHNDGFISEFQFVPHQTEELENLIVENYKKLRGLLPCEAETKYLDQARRLDMYGVDIHPVKGQDEMDYLLGLSPSGIVLFKNKNRIANFIWPKITKLKYKSNSFLLRATQGRSDDEKEYTFICRNKDYAKGLWKHCAEHHAFFRLDRGSDFPSANNFLFKKHSTFKFSGRTQQEIERDIDSHPRTQPAIRRVPSQRYSRRGILSPDEKKNSHLLPNNDGAPMSPLSAISDISAPWEAVFSEQSGLYTNGQHNSYPNRKATMPTADINDYRRKQSGYHSSGEAEQKRKRSQYYSGYTSGDTTAGEFRSVNNRHSGSAPNVHHKQNVISSQPRHMAHQVTPNKSTRQHRHSHTNSLHGDQSERMVEYERRYRPSGTKSDSEETNKMRRHQLHRQRIAGGNQSESELVAPLDIYHTAVGMGVPNEDHQRQRVKRHHHHRKPQGRHSAYQFDPNQATVLLELGPNTSTPSNYITSNTSTPQSYITHAHSTSFDNKENIHEPPQYGANYQYASDVSTGNAPQQYIHNYLPRHLLRKGRTPSGGVPDVYSTPSSRVIRNESANYNVSTEL